MALTHLENSDLPRHYEIEGALYPAMDGKNWGAVTGAFMISEWEDKPADYKYMLTPATTELDRYCLKMYGSMFDKIDTSTQRILENLHKKGGLNT